MNDVEGYMVMLVVVVCDSKPLKLGLCEKGSESPERRGPGPQLSPLLEPALGLLRA